MVLAVVDGVMQPGHSGLVREPARLEEPAQERHAVEEEAELSRDERRAEEDEHRGERDPQPVATRLPLRRGPDCEHQHDGESEPQRRHRVQRLGVEVRLVDAEVDDGAERDRSDAGDPQPAVQPRPGEPHERDPDQREREVERNELPPESRGDSAVVDVVQLARRKTRVRRDDGDAVEHQEGEYRAHLPGHSLHSGGQLPARYA